MTTPVAILVNGLPGAGKTTLARTLSRHLELPMFSKDIIKEAHAAVAVKRPELMVRCPPSGNLNAPVMALAWRAADFIIAGS
ncbi:zeta toxin family protein [Actinomadura sp. 21ATH]|uniref:zeta toxin family protein n=1 Tax=Actinomadura sp. 21ATH TaxID=1735444 RepID=UPI0035C1EE6C